MKRERAKEKIVRAHADHAAPPRRACRLFVALPTCSARFAWRVFTACLRAIYHATRLFMEIEIDRDEENNDDVAGCTNIEMFAVVGFTML